MIPLEEDPNTGKNQLINVSNGKYNTENTIIAIIVAARYTLTMHANPRMVNTSR